VVVTADGVGVELVGGRREKRFGEGVTKERYWSRTYTLIRNGNMFENEMEPTCSIKSPVPSFAANPANSSNRARGRGSINDI
jgi:hypothetical protein